MMFNFKIIIILISLFFHSVLYPISSLSHNLGRIDVVKIYNYLKFNDFDGIYSKKDVKNSLRFIYPNYKKVRHRPFLGIITNLINRIPILEDQLKTKLKGVIGVGSEKYIFQTSDGRAVAMYFAIDEAQKRLRKELDILTSISHKNIISLSEYSYENLYTVQEVACCDLLTLISAKKGIIKLVDIFKILKGIAEGIKYLTDRHIVHHDIKLDNILIFKDEDDNYIPKIIDFSFAISYPRSEKYVLNDVLSGSPSYIDPFAVDEYKNNDGVYKCSSRIDLYAYSILVYTLFNFEYPIDIYYKNDYVYNSDALTRYKDAWVFKGWRPTWDYSGYNISDLKSICEAIWSENIIDPKEVSKTLSEFIFILNMHIATMDKNLIYFG